MPVHRANNQAAFTPQSPIADINTGAVNTTYDQAEVDVITSLRTAVNSVLTALRNQGLIRTALVYTVTQSSAYGATLTGTYANLTDGIASTGAGTNSSSSEWIRADLGTVTTMSSVTVAGGSLPSWGAVASYLNGTVVQVSLDATSWTTVATITGVTDTDVTRVRTFAFASVSARYVRLARSGYLSTTEFLIA